MSRLGRTGAIALALLVLLALLPAGAALGSLRHLEAPTPKVVCQEVGPCVRQTHYNHTGVFVCTSTSNCYPVVSDRAGCRPFHIEDLEPSITPYPVLGMIVIDPDGCAASLPQRFVEDGYRDVYLWVHWLLYG